jgi:hypothetical protein
MKKLLLIALLIVGCVFGDTIQDTTIENQCFQDGYIAGNKFSTDDVLIYGVSIYIILAPITYFFVSKSHPKPVSKKLEDLDEECKRYFLVGYEKGSIKRRKSAALYGAATIPGMLLGAFVIGSIQQGKFPPDL